MAWFDVRPFLSDNRLGEVGSAIGAGWIGQTGIDEITYAGMHRAIGPGNMTAVFDTFGRVAVWGMLGLLVDLCFSWGPG